MEDIEKIIKDLYVDNKKFNYKAVKLARENKDRITEPLLKELKKNINEHAIKNGTFSIFVDYALFLLAEFKEKRACSLILELISLPCKSAYDMLGDGIISKIPSIIASVYDGSLEAINAVIENNKINASVRSEILTFYQYLYENDLLEKEKLIEYLKKIISQFYNDKCENFEYITDTVFTMIINCHLFEMIDDVRFMFDNDLIDYSISGSYSTFIDDIFNYNPILEPKIYQITSVEDSMAWWYYFENDTDKTKAIKGKSSKNINKDLQDVLENSKKEFDYSKIGRNDPCPCGSGKKFKKCCIDKINNALPYQKYITAALSEYPKKNNNKNEVDFYTYYNEEYIKIDHLLYKVLCDKKIPYFIKRDFNRELQIDYEDLTKAWTLIKNVIDNNSFKTLEDYDKIVSIHYSIEFFIEKYGHCILKMNEIFGTPPLSVLEELIKYFYDKFEITSSYSHIFLDLIANYFFYTKKYKKGILVFEEWLKKDIYCKHCVYKNLFEMYFDFYDYDESLKKMSDTIDKTEDVELKDYLEELRLDYLNANVDDIY